MKWIKASDELPPAGKPVVIRDEDGYTYSDMAIAWDKDITNYQWLDETEDAGEDWISVVDKMPEIGDIIDTWNGVANRRAILVGDKDENEIEFKRYIEPLGSETVYSYYYPDITHWRPLPQPPK